MKFAQVAAIALVWLIVSFGLGHCDEQENFLEDSPNKDFDDYSSLTSSISKTFDDEDYGDSLTKNRPYPIDLRQLPGLPTDVQALPVLRPSDLFQITVTIPPAGGELFNQPDLSDIDVLSLDGTLGPDGFTSFAPLA
ncbi:hypothetical protein GHT06_022825 [Daphnia sinensis]|uniref:Uncharacterized protein n=1 Tax=Daphnia sinensis TaxID=1820382 RepID=A0AAD5KI61_9CRUS|nr:hypothetical protein GHT06_022825 [Daphnia sinensis]